MSTGACQKSSRDHVSFWGLQVHDGVPFTAWIAALILIGSLFLLAEVSASARARWELVWSDEFNGSPNSPPDPLKWTHDLGTNNGWGNEELDNDTNLPENAHLDGKGHLIIHVESTPAGYTSARIKTEGLFTSLYGRIEARIKLPSGQGIWPAFWMLGADIDAVGWPKCGEIDIMENIGKEPSVNHGSLHGPGYSGSIAMTAAIYTAEWQEAVQRLPHFRHSMGSRGSLLLRRWQFIRDPNVIERAPRRRVGLQPSILFGAQCSRWRKVSGIPG